VSGLDLAFYGDDLTGSTDVLEALFHGGVPARLFLDIPDAEDIAALGEVRAVGIAGGSRAQTPEWMDRHLPPAFEALKRLGAPIVHYKVCSTFDSAPHLGSIGRALEIGLRVFGCGVVPVVVGLPRNGRYTAFGHLFATALGLPEAYRIDRHPVMARHPKTPMQDSDLVAHLGRQTSLPVELIDFRALADGSAEERLAGALARGPRAVLLDCLDAASSAAVGRLLRAHPWTVPSGFVVGSSGVEYALLDAAPRRTASPPVRIGAVDRLLVLSGSCSSTTAVQIAHAERLGWAVIALGPLALLDEARREGALAEAAARAGEALARGRSVVVATARGPDEPTLSEAAARAEAAGIDTAERFGAALGALARAALEGVPALRRVVVAGGDTSSFAGRALGIRAVEAVGPATPGSPLCRVVAGAPGVTGLEILFKGGQVGGADHFERVRLGLTAEEPVGAAA